MQGRWKQTLVIFFAGFLVLVSVTPIASIREALHGPSTNTVEVGIMSLWSGSDGRLKEESAYESELASLVQSLDAEGADFILLPEGGEYKGAPTKTLHVYSEPYRPKGSKPYSGIFAGYERHPREEYLLRTKIALAPQGEYPVWVYSGPFELLGLNEISSSLTGGAGFITGTLGKPLALGTTSVSLMFCLEIFMPSLGAKLVQVQGTDLLAVAISYASFSRPYTLDTDARRALRIQAVHAGVPLVSSADYTSAYAFDRYGNELARIGGERGSEYRVVSLPL